MASTRQFCWFAVVVLIFGSFLEADKVPSTDDIDDYNDPVLREVFASSRKQRPNVGELRPHEVQSVQAPVPAPTRSQSPYAAPYSAPSYSVTQRPTYSYGNPQTAYRPTYAGNTQPALSSGYNNQGASDLGNLASQGAQTFLQGAQQVGRVFGIDGSSYGSGGNSGYEFPISGGFFGK